MIKPEYVEMKFALPFYELYFLDTWNDGNLPQNPYELIELTTKLEIDLDTDFLFKIYDQAASKKGDIYLFFQNGNNGLVKYQ